MAWSCPLEKYSQPFEDDDHSWEGIRDCHLHKINYGKPEHDFSRKNRSLAALTRGWALETVVSGGRLHLSTHDGEYPAILAVFQPGPVPSRSTRIVYGF
jgi:hypothetical protein